MELKQQKLQEEIKEIRISLNNQIIKVMILKLIVNLQNKTEIEDLLLETNKKIDEQYERINEKLSQAISQGTFHSVITKLLMI